MATTMPSAVDANGGAFTKPGPSNPRNNPSLASNVDGLVDGLIQTERIVVGPTWINALNGSYNILGNGSNDDTAGIAAFLQDVATTKYGVLPPNHVYNASLISAGTAAYRLDNCTLQATGATIQHIGAQNALLFISPNVPGVDAVLHDFRLLGFPKLVARQTLVNPTSQLLHVEGLWRSTIEAFLEGGDGSGVETNRYATSGLYIQGRVNDSVYDSHMNVFVHGCTGDGITIDGFDTGNYYVNDNVILFWSERNTGSGFNHGGGAVNLCIGISQSNTNFGFLFGDDCLDAEVHGDLETNTAGDIGVSVNALANHPGRSSFYGTCGLEPSIANIRYLKHFESTVDSFYSASGKQLFLTALSFQRSSAGQTILKAQRDADTGSRIVATVDGGLSWGPGDGSFDVTQARSAGQGLLTGQKYLATGGLGSGGIVAATTPGSVVKKMPIYNDSGSLQGYIPVYDAIT